jgi:serine/threonine-protein kinase
MEYVEGKTLYDMMLPPPHGDGHNFSEDETLDVIGQIADALAHSHARGLIHRDVKPKNIILTPGGVAKLTDLGLARERNDKAAAESEAGKAYGTPYYISPEQIRGEVDIDFRADIYSLGATMYHLVTGTPPFDGDTPSAVMHKHLKQPLVPPDHLNTSLSAGIGEIIEVAMAKNRDERYTSTEDMLEDLRLLRKGEPPIHARRQVDLDALASNVEHGARTVDIEPHGFRRALSWDHPLVITILAVCGISVLLNLIFAAVMLAK